MTIEEIMNSRRSIRKYKTTSITGENLEKIIKAGLQAPSAVNLQPWYFVVIKNAAAKKELIHLMGTAEKQLTLDLQKRFAAYPEVIGETLQFVKTLGNAPVCILVFQYKDNYGARAQSVVQSIAAAIENMIIAAWSINIGSCWMTAPVECGIGGKIENKFAPDKGQLIAAITFGYPDQIPTMPKRKENRFIIV